MLVSDENINFINLFSRHPSPSRHILAVDDLIGNLSISDILHSNKTTTFKSLNISVRVDRVVGFALRFTDSIYFIFRRRTGHREDNGRQVREGHRRLHQWPRAGLGLLGRAVVSGAGDQHALVHPLKERYSCRPTWGGGVVGSTPQLGIWKFKNNESQRARVAKWRAASRRESAPDEKCTPPNRSPPPQLIPPQTTPPPTRIMHSDPRAWTARGSTVFVQTHLSAGGTLENEGDWVAKGRQATDHRRARPWGVRQLYCKY